MFTHSDFQRDLQQLNNIIILTTGLGVLQLELGFSWTWTRFWSQKFLQQVIFNSIF